jgi:hypothetical protein
VADYYFERELPPGRAVVLIEEKNPSADQKKRYYFNKGYTFTE